MAKPEKTNAMRSLERMGIVYETLTYASCGTAVDAQTVAALMNVPPDTVYKTLVLLGSDRQHYVCVIPGPRELDLKLASAHFGIKSMAMLPMAQLKDVTGYERGGVLASGHEKGPALRGGCARGGPGPRYCVRRPHWPAGTAVARRPAARGRRGIGTAEQAQMTAGVTGV